jgi:hypothetical protein
MKKLLLLIFIFLSSVGCEKSNMENTVVSNKIKDFKTFCIGRHSIELPKSFVSSGGTTAVFIPLRSQLNEEETEIQISLIKSGISLNEFQNLVVARKAEIVSEARERTGILSDSRKIGSMSHLFRIQIIDASFLTEVHSIIGDSYYIAQSTSYQNKFLEAEKKLQYFLNNIKLSKKEPNKSGFCLGEVDIFGQFEREYAKYSFSSGDFPGLVFGVEYDTYVPDPEESLLHRLEGPSSLLRAFDANNKVLRKGELNISSMQAEEWLSWIILGDGAAKQKQYGFALETMRRKPSIEHPQIHVELDAKKPLTDDSNPTTLSEEEIVSLWDSATRSIRSRVSGR